MTCIHVLPVSLLCVLCAPDYRHTNRVCLYCRVIVINAAGKQLSSLLETVSQKILT